MALDSKQKRGSAIGVTMPSRSWLAEPDGTLASTDRLSLMKLCATIEPGELEVFTPPYYVSASQALTPGMVASDAILPGARATQAGVP